MSNFNKKYTKSIHKMSRVKLEKEAIKKAELSLYLAKKINSMLGNIHANEVEIDHLESFLKSAEHAMEYKERKIEHLEKCLKAVTSWYEI